MKQFWNVCIFGEDYVYTTPEIKEVYGSIEDVAKYMLDRQLEVEEELKKLGEPEFLEDDELMQHSTVDSLADEFDKYGYMHERSRYECFGIDYFAIPHGNPIML